MTSSRWRVGTLTTCALGAGLGFYYSFDYIAEGAKKIGGMLQAKATASIIAMIKEEDEGRRLDENLAKIIVNNPAVTSSFLVPLRVAVNQRIKIKKSLKKLGALKKTGFSDKIAAIDCWKELRSKSLEHLFVSAYSVTLLHVIGAVVSSTFGRLSREKADEGTNIGGADTTISHDDKVEGMKFLVSYFSTSGVNRIHAVVKKAVEEEMASWELNEASVNAQAKQSAFLTVLERVRSRLETLHFADFVVDRDETKFGSNGASLLVSIVYDVIESPYSALAIYAMTGAFFDTYEKIVVKRVLFEDDCESCILGKMLTYMAIAHAKDSIGMFREGTADGKEENTNEFLLAINSSKELFSLSRTLYISSVIPSSECDNEHPTGTVTKEEE
eukprot:g4493.t1